MIDVGGIWVESVVESKRETGHCDTCSQLLQEIVLQKA